MAQPAEIRPEHLVTDILSTVDKMMELFVKTGHQQFITSYDGVITTVMTLYVMGLAYRFTIRTLEMDLITVMRHLICLLSIYGLLLKWDLFWLFFYNILANEPNHLIKTMMDGNGQLTVNGSSADVALNTVFTKGMDAVSSLFKQANWDNKMMYLYAIAVFVVTCLSCIYALGLLVYGKLGLAVMLFLAPIFLLFFLFSSTRRLFENWLQLSINFAFIPILTCAILMLMLTLAQIALPGLNQKISSGEVNFTGLLPYLCISLVTFFLLKQVLPLCATLTQSLALESLAGMTPMAKNALKYSGVNLAAGWVLNKLRGKK